MAKIRRANPEDFAAIWPFFRDIVAAGTTYAYPVDITFDDARAAWMTAPRATYVLEDDGAIVGTYILKTNQTGGGDHVCNCGYMVAPEARGRGYAKAMCLHSQKEALRLDYWAMQFNFVLASNTGALHLWKTLGFEIVGTLPRAFRHPTEGLVDAHVMYKWLGQS